MQEERVRLLESTESGKWALTAGSRKGCDS